MDFDPSHELPTGIVVSYIQVMRCRYCVTAVKFDLSSEHGIRYTRGVTILIVARERYVTYLLAALSNS